MPSRLEEHDRVVRCAQSGCRSVSRWTTDFVIPALLGVALVACERAHPRVGAGGAALEGYTSGMFCATADGVNHKVDCGCPGAPCDDGDPATLFDFCADDMNTCLPGTTSAAEVCGNGVDDDCDLLVDDRDPECRSGCAQREDCSSPVDDDCDGMVNEEDSYDCLDSGWGCWPGTGFVAVQCNWWCVPHCFDGWQDGDEGGVDCGGACDAKCTPGEHCWSPYDCASGVCLNDVCA